MKAWTKTEGEGTLAGCPRCVQSNRRGKVVRFPKGSSGLSDWMKAHRNHDG